MYAFFISLLAGLAVGLFTGQESQLGSFWGVFCGLVAMFVVNLLVGLAVRRKVAAVQRAIEEKMKSAQAKIAHQLQLFQQRPSGDVRSFQKRLEDMQNNALREALRGTVDLEKFFHWNWLLSRQVGTMRLQLYFQLKEFDKVDELMPKSLLFDPRSKLIKLVRLYKSNSPELDKYFQRKLRRLKGEEGAFAACVYAWMKLKQGDNAPAVAALVHAKQSSDNQTMLENYDRLVNGKFKHFSNANFGDLWYSLYLEEPKVRTMRANARQGF